MSAWLAAGLAAGWLAFEAAAWALVRALRPGFPWLITRADTAPVLDGEAVARHLARGFDAELGWCRRPGETGADETEAGTARYTIDARGRRRSPGFEEAPSEIAVYGDSFAFCRLVDDDEAWPHLLARRLGVCVGNHAAGNYGLDQALLRLERELPGMAPRIVVMAVVPETIARVQSYWKHYFEYGNLLAFKPRFTLEDGRLVHHPPAVRDAAELTGYARQLDRIQRLDPFYQAKFRPDLLGFPYLPRLLARARRHGPILWHLAAGRLAGRAEAGWRRAFAVILAENAAWTARLYRDSAATALLAALVERFAAACRGAGAEPVLLILPQPMDLDRADGGRVSEPFFARLAARLPVLDLTAAFRGHPDRAALFRAGRLGPHPSPAGNRLIADGLHPLLAALGRPARRQSA